MTKKLIAMLLAIILVAGAAPTAASEAVEDGALRLQPQTIYTSSGTSMVIKDDNSLWAWGYNECAQVGDGSKALRTRPVKIMDEVAEIITKYQTTMAIKTDGSLWAWGSNSYGVLGNGTKENISTPQKIMDGVKSVTFGTSAVTQIDVVFAVKTDDSLWAWGNNERGELGDGTLESKTTPVKIMDNVVSVKNFVQFTMALKTDNTLWAWGYLAGDPNAPRDNSIQGSDMLGQVRTSYISYPYEVLDNIRQFSVNDSYSSSASLLTIRTDGSLWAGGQNQYGQLGDGTAENKPLFSQVKIMDDVVSVLQSDIYANALAIKEDGSLWSWGRGPGGLIGDGTTEDRSSPIKIMDTVDSAYMNNDVCMALKRDGSLWSWGGANNGMLGNGYGYAMYLDSSNLDQYIYIGSYSGPYLAPRKIMDNVVAVSMSPGGTLGGENMLALKTDGSLFIWGKNTYGFYMSENHGILGLGENADYFSPTPLKVMDDVKLPTSQQTATPPAPDVPSTWAVEQVNAAIAAGLVPDALQSKYTTATTRAEFCALAVALYEKYTGAAITERAQFSDTADVNVQKMAALGVVNGVGDGKFAPDDKLTREQAATMLARLAAAISKPLTKQAATFTDNTAISSWAFDAVGQMQATGIMGGVGNNTFAPKDPYTREQSIITMMRLWES